MSGAEPTELDRFVFGIRYVEGQIDRAELRTTLTYRFHPRFSAGIEYNPLADDVSPLANWLVIGEKERRPAIMIGTSSDRIGTPHGQSYYVTASKNLKPWIDFPISPYVGATYGTYDDKARLIGGANIQFTDELSSLVIYDGVHGHPTLSWTRGRHVLSLLMVRGVHPGLAYSISFDLPSADSPPGLGGSD